VVAGLEVLVTVSAGVVVVEGVVKVKGQR